jgi:hypothetical protein
VKLSRILLPTYPAPVEHHGGNIAGGPRSYIIIFTAEIPLYGNAGGPVEIELPSLKAGASPETVSSGFTDPLTIPLGSDFHNEKITYTPRADAGVPNFAKPFVEKVHSLNLAPQTSYSPRLCSSCSSIPMGKLLEERNYKTHKLFDAFPKLRESAGSCELCAMILSAIETFEKAGVKKINVGFSGSCLKI